MPLGNKLCKKNYPQWSGYKKAHGCGGGMDAMNVLQKILRIFTHKEAQPLKCSSETEHIEITEYDVFSYCPECLWTPELLNTVKLIVCKKCGTHLKEGVGRVHRKYTFKYIGLEGPYCAFYYSKFLPKETYVCSLEDENGLTVQDCFQHDIDALKNKKL